MKKLIIVVTLFVLCQKSFSESLNLKFKDSDENSKYLVTLTYEQLQFLFKMGVFNQSNKITPLSGCSSKIGSPILNCTVFDSSEVFEDNKRIESIGGNW